MQPLPTVCTPNTKEFYKQKENDEHDGEINDKQTSARFINDSDKPSAIFD